MEDIPKELGKALSWEPQRFFRAARSGEFLLQRCLDCQALLGPGAWVCDVCRGEELRWTRHDGVGSIYAVATVHHVYIAALTASVPYHVVIVELDEGLRLPGRLMVDLSTTPVAVGARVKVGFANAGPRVVPVFVLDEPPLSE